MDKKVFTAKQVYILVFAIVTGIAFIETSGAMWSGEFWKQFIMNLLVYGFVSEFVVILLANFLNKD